MIWGNNKSADKKRTDAFKTIIIGDCNVGKTSIIKRYLYNKFTTQTDSTIGASFSCTRREEKDRYKKLDIWDTAGQERYRTIINIYYRGADACILVCDLTKKDSIDNLEYWIKDLLERTDNKEIEVILVGNKTDILRDQGIEEVIASEKMIDLSKKYNYPIFLTSALDSSNIEKMFDLLLDRVDIPFSQGGRRETLEVVVHKKPNVLNQLTGWCNLL